MDQFCPLPHTPGHIFFSNPSLTKQLVNEDGLESHSDDLGDSANNEDGVGEGENVVEESHSYGYTAVDVDEEHSEVQKKQIDCVLLRVFLINQSLYLEESNQSCQEPEKIDRRVENLAHKPDAGVVMVVVDVGEEQD